MISFYTTSRKVKKVLIATGKVPNDGASRKKFPKNDISNEIKRRNFSKGQIFQIVNSLLKLSNTV